MRPLNWCRIAEAVAANDTTIVIDADPGLYATKYRYPLPGGMTKPINTADNAIAASDYVAFQLLDGTWHISTVASVSSLTLTLDTATPNVTGGGAALDTVLYFFGVAANTNPQTGAAHLSIKSGAGTSRVVLIPEGSGSIPALNPGDPLILYSANATNAGVLTACGFYADY
jgi:hypothetical protein